MPITQTIDHARRAILARAWGVISYPDVVAHLGEERDAGGLTYAELIDMRDGEPEVAMAEVRRLVEDLRRLGRDGPLGPTAVVVSSEFAYGMLRMLETLVEDVCAVRPFREMADAERWLAEQQAPPHGVARGML